MTRNEAQKRIEKLRETINYHRYLYHVLDKQEISDWALDSLKKELFELEQKFPELITPDSPTQRIGGKSLEKFEKARHSSPMLSFNDAFSKKDLEEWLKRISKLAGFYNIDFFCELKIDGLAVELVYKKGVLEVGSTRGDGLIGEDVTQNLKTIEAIPLRLRDNIDAVVRGEVFISKKEFEKVNKEKEKAGEPTYANPRNLAAGSIRQLDPKIASKRGLDFFAYDLVSDSSSKTHQDRHEILKKIGFKVNPYNKYCLNLDEVVDFYDKCQKLREKLYYEIDGLVVIVNNNELFEKLGVVGKAPRGAVAFKFPAKQATTVVEDIKVQIGRTGALTPVAYLKPVKIGGTTVSRATLHNEDEIKRLGIKIGDTVIVERAGDVIPDVVKVLEELRTGQEKDFKMPKYCPVCGKRTERKKDQAAYYCTNSKCFAVYKKLFYHFVSKPAFNIEGLGPKIIDKLLDAGLVSSPSDFFHLKEGDLVPLERFADKSAENLIRAINKSKEVALARFIYALGIRNVGIETAEDLAQEFSSLEKLEKAELKDLESIKDIGPVVSQSVYYWFLNNKLFLEKLKKAGIEIKDLPHSKPKALLRGLTFVLTGELESLARDEAAEKIRSLGGSVSNSVSKKTSFIVAGKNPGLKYDKAKKLNVKIINEESFLKLL